jgi:twitching motility protein PilT
VGRATRPAASTPAAVPDPTIPPGAPIAPVASPAPAVAAPSAAAASIAPPSLAPAEMAALRELLARAAALQASDLHLCEGEPPAVRVDGRLRPLRDGSLELAARALDELLAGRAPGEPSPSPSMDHGLDVPGVGRARVNLYRTLGRMAAAVRLLPPAAPTLAELDLPQSLSELADAPHGLVLVCGPTGAGKSATLAALAQEALSRRGGLLITLEDPVEYAIQPPPSSLVRQRQIGSDARDFGSGLRDALREDPDVLLVGEMRDAESISLALTAAETGHLVLASMHSRSSASTVQRIVDACPPERHQQIRGQLADALRAVVCQRLLPRTRGGRVASLEILRVTHAVGTLIREGKLEQLASAIQSGRKEGMLPLERCLADQVRAGTIDRKTAVFAANDSASLLAYLQG